jgi:1-deoxy-D-xylulose-5-phosphate reductoisomerase
MKRITILGATGSIGRNCLQVIKAYPNEFKVIGLSTHHRVDLLYEQCLKFKPEMVCITGKDFPLTFFEKIEQLGIEIITGKQGLEELASRSDVDILFNGLVGSSGLLPTLAAINQKVDIALANKEIIVMAGEIITSLAEQNGVRILPVDSEHSAIFQCIQGENQSQINRLILTASGGPFQKYPAEQLENVTIEQALKHPHWCMGNKISIDSATQMNKGLEIIEAHWLFRVPVSQIEVLIHPESIIHSMVEFIDGAIKAQLGIPDMKIAIQYALTYPARKYCQSERLSFNLLSKLTFEPPDFQRFPACALAYESLRKGGTAPAVFNAANEEAVQYFIQQKIKFNQIIKLVEKSLYQHEIISNPSLEEILAADLWARNLVKEAVREQEVLVVSF